MQPRKTLFLYIAEFGHGNPKPEGPATANLSFSYNFVGVKLKICRKPLLVPNIDRPAAARTILTSATISPTLALGPSAGPVQAFWTWF